MTALKLATYVAGITAVSGLVFGWATPMFPIGAIAACAWLILWGLDRALEDDGLVPHSFGESFDNAAEAMQYDINDELPYRPGRTASGLASRNGSTRMTVTDDRTHSSRSAWGLSTARDVEPWKDRAVCAQTDPEAFFPDKGGSTAEAKRICRACPVTDECLQSALDNDERFGIWGGYSERERRRIKRGEHVEFTINNKPNRRPNGHGHACKCFDCRELYR